MRTAGMVVIVGLLLALAAGLQQVRESRYGTPAEIAGGDGRSVLAIERGGELIRRLDPDFAIDPGDGVWVGAV